MVWIIVHKHAQDLAWSNRHGWVHRIVDRFSDEEKRNFSLPIDGEWEAIDEEGELG